MTENTFWQANFWGIVGTASGVVGLVISWLNWRYSKPKINLVKVELEIPWRSVVKDYAGKPRQQEYWAEFTLHIRFRNKKGGPGSIEKPLLAIRYEIDNSFFFPQFKKHTLKPKTHHTEYERECPNVSTIRTIRDGEAWNFFGGQTVDDELKYTFLSSEFYDFAQNWDRVEYFIEYYNNVGKRFKKKILQVRKPG